MFVQLEKTYTLRFRKFHEPHVSGHNDFLRRVLPRTEDNIAGPRDKEDKTKKKILP